MPQRERKREREKERLRERMDHWRVERLEEKGDDAKIAAG